MAASAGGMPRVQRTGTRPWGALALAVVSEAAGLIHLAFVREHVHEYVPFGVFFLVVGVFQLAWAAMVLAPRRPWFLVTGILVNAATIALWIVTRTVGLPIGPEHWTAEAARWPDVTAGVLEAILVLGCAAVLAMRGRRGPASDLG
jgi:hypothetical protein